MALFLLIAGCAGEGGERAEPDPPVTTDEQQAATDVGEDEHTDTEPSGADGATLSTAVFDGEDLDIAGARCFEGMVIPLNEGRLDVAERADGSFFVGLYIVRDDGPDTHASYGDPNFTHADEEVHAYELDSDGIRASIELRIMGADADPPTGLLELDLVFDDWPRIEVDNCPDPDFG